MSSKKWYALILAVSILSVMAVPSVQFFIGGVFINLGYRFQDHIEHGFEKVNQSEFENPEKILETVMRQNDRASTVRQIFPRTVRHPQVALLTCMDARIDTVELTGDTRRYYYTLRTAGSILGHLQQEMLELAVRNGVKVLILTTHTDCAAEKIVKDTTENHLYPYLTQGILDREKMVRSFQQRPYIADKINKKELLIVHAQIDTKTGRLLLHEL